MTEKWNSGKFCFFVFYVMNIFLSYNHSGEKQEMCKIPAINGKWHMYRAICGKQNAKYAEFCIFC